MGVVVSDTASDTRMATDSTTANSRNSRPMIPPISRIGMNTATSDRLMDITVEPICAAPVMAAVSGSMPISWYRVMFSSTTMASSTTNPVEMASAMSERLSTLYPSRNMAAKVPMMDAGTAIRGISVARNSRRNRKTTRPTRATDRRSVRSMSATEARMVWRLVEPDAHDDGRIDARMQLRQRRVDPVDRGDDVGARLAEDDEQGGPAAVGQAERPDRLDRVLHRRDPGERDRLPVAVGDDEGRIVLRLHELVVGGDRPALVGVRKAALGLVRGLRHDRASHALQSQSVPGQLRGIDVDPYRRRRTAADDHLAHPRDLRQPLRQHRRGGIVQRRRRQLVGRQCDDHDGRVRRVHLPVGRICWAGWPAGSCAPR